MRSDGCDIGGVTGGFKHIDTVLEAYPSHTHAPERIWGEFGRYSGMVRMPERGVRGGSGATC